MGIHRYLVIFNNFKLLILKEKLIGALEVIRTPDIRLRRPTLYPAELRAQCLVDSPQFIDNIGFILFAHINLSLSIVAIICNILYFLDLTALNMHPECSPQINCLYINISSLSYLRRFRL